MNSEVYFEGKKYVSVKKASQLTGYSRDYVGQLCREGKITSQRIDRSWFVLEESILSYKAPTGVDLVSSNKTNENNTSRSNEISKVLKNKDFSAVKMSPISTSNLLKIAVLSFALPILVAGILSVGKSEITGVSQMLRSAPIGAYSVVDETTDFYATKLSKIYIEQGEMILNESGRFIENPIGYSVGKMERVLSKGSVLLSDISNRVAGVSASVKKLSQEFTNTSLLDNNNDLLLALVRSPLDGFGSLVYDKINQYIEWGVYSPYIALFGNEYLVASPVYGLKEESPEPVLAESKPTPSTVNTTKVVNNYSVIERTVESVVNGGVSKEYVDLSLQQLQNKLTAEFTKLSFNSGGTVTSIYQQIAHSQRIDNLYNTFISTPRIVGGTISDMVIAATSLSATNASINTLSTSNLSITGAGTNVLLATDSNGLVVSTSTPSFANFNAMSTTATSTVASGGFAIGGSQFVVQQNSGRIGIGTTTPSATLDLVQSSNGTPLVWARRSTDLAPTGDFINYRTADSGTTLFRVDNSGNLLAGGIVTSGSQTITSISTPQSRVQYDASNEMTFSASSNGSTTIAAGGTNSSINFATQNNLVNAFNFMNSSGGSVLNIDNLNGRVGIGTTTPRVELQIDGTGGLMLPSGTTAQRPTTLRGTIRYNTTNTIFEGYNGTNWSGLGGVIDVDMNTFILAETSSGSNEDNLYFNTGGSEKMRITSGGNVGIGTTTPGQRLSVAGDILGNNIIGSYFTATSTTATSTFAGGLAVGTNYLNVLQNGNVGIGTANPSSKLFVNGAIRNSDNISGDSGLAIVSGDRLGFDQNGVRSWNIKATGGNLEFNSGDGNGFHKFNTSVLVTGTTGFTGLLTFGNASGTQLTTTGSTYLATSGGNVGIGTTVPGVKLEVTGAIKSATTLSDTLFSGAYLSIANADSSRNWGIQQNTSNSLLFNYYNGSGSDNMVTFRSNGNVGIGTTTPVSKFHISDTSTTGSDVLTLHSGADNEGEYTGLVLERTDGINLGAIRSYLGSGGLSRTSILTGDAAGNALADRLTITSVGNVGIGTTSPYKLLSIKDSSNANTAQITVSDLSASLAKGYVGNFSDALYLTSGGTYANGWVSDSASRPIASITIDSSTSGGSVINFGTAAANATAPTTRVTVNKDGNVGIGTVNPSQKLEVSGKIHITGASGTTGDINAGSAGVYSWNGASRYVRFNTNGAINDLQSIGAALVINFGDAHNVIIGGSQLLAPNKLNVMGNLGVGASYGAIAAPASGMIIEGNVGIGTTNPQTKLDVLGTSSSTLYYANAGTAAAPGYSFAADSNTGLINPGADQLGISIGGTTRMSFDTDSFYGVGTGAPRINTKSTATYDETTYSFVGDQDTGMYRGGANELRFSTANTDRLTINSSGNVGIGTTTPNSWQGVSNLAGVNTQIYSSLNEARLIINANAASPELHLVGGGNITNDRNYRLKVDGDGITLDQPSDNYSTTQQLMTWTKMGSVGIGTTNPDLVGSTGITGTTNLKVYRSDAVSRVIVEGITPALHLGDLSGTINQRQWRTQVSGGYYQISSATDSYGTINDRFVIQHTSGNVGIGTTTPSSKLQVSGGNITLDSGSTVGLASNGSLVLTPTTIGGSAGSMVLNSTGVFTFRNSAGSAQVTFNDGNVGIGTTSPIFSGNNSKFLTLDGGGTGSTFAEIGVGNNQTGTSAFLGGYGFFNSGLSTTEKRNAAMLAYNDGAINSGELRFVTASAGTLGTNMVIKSSGNIGIGTTTPADKLEVVGNLSINSNDTTYGSGIRWRNSADVSKWALGPRVNVAADDFEIADGVNTRLIVKDSTGNVGIGTTNPSTKLAIYTDNATNPLVIRNTSNSNRTLFGTNISSNNGELYVYDSTETAKVALLSSGASYLTGGNVGIGTTTPWAQLSVNPNGITGPAFVIGSSTATSLVVTNGGNVGIGTAVPNGVLDIRKVGSSFTDQFLFSGFGSAGANRGIKFSVSDEGSSSGLGKIQAFRVTDNTVMPLVLNPDGGSVGIGTTNPTAAFHTRSSNGNIASFVSTATNGSYASFYKDTSSVMFWGSELAIRGAGSAVNGILSGGHNGDGGNLVIYGNYNVANSGLQLQNGLFSPVVDNVVSNGDATHRWTAVYAVNGTIQTSDEREKHNILGTTLGLEFINKLRPVQYEYNDIAGVREGFIAQEVVTALNGQSFEGGVMYSTTTDRYGLNYSAFVTPAIKAIQELDYKIESIASSTPETGSLGERVITNIFTKITGWLADATNGITQVIAGTFKAKDRLCINDTCVTEAQLQALLLNASGGGNNGQATSTPPVDSSIPVITILGDNPSIITMGTSYSDMGATVTDTNGDGSVNDNLGLQFTVNGVSMQNISLDTSATSTNTIIYSAVDGAGNWGYATRTVEVIEQ